MAIRTRLSRYKPCTVGRAPRPANDLAAPRVQPSDPRAADKPAQRRILPRLDEAPWVLPKIRRARSTGWIARRRPRDPRSVTGPAGFRCPGRAGPIARGEGLGTPEAS